MKSKNIVLAVLFSLIAVPSLMANDNYNKNWPTWRGPFFAGAIENCTPPIEWSDTKNIKWKKAIPGNGLSTPVIWGDQIFITSAIELDEKAAEEAIKKLKKSTPNVGEIFGMLQTTEHFQQFVVYSINRHTGEINWQKTVREQYPHEGIHKTNSWASASCVTDGEHVIASFGSYGIYCLDLQGNILWEKDFGDMQVDMAFGEGTSPALYKDYVVIVWDHQEQSKIHVLNKKTGKEIWQKDREEATTWATPLVVNHKGVEQIIVPGKVKSVGYNIATGNQIWELGGLKQDIIPCPVYDGTNVYLMTGFIANKIVQAINMDLAQGKLDSTNAVVWKNSKNAPYVPSPLLVDGKLYYINGNKCRLSCVDTKTGKSFYKKERLEGLSSAYASPVSANGYIYFSDRKGNFSVIKTGDNFETVATNKLDDNFDASPAIVGNNLYLRGHDFLYCISE